MFYQAHYPRPEYPRPDFQRGIAEGIDWINLNGPWGFRFDPDRRGVTESWFAKEGPLWREQILVPFCWESLAAWGEADQAGNENYFANRVFRNPREVTRWNHRSAPRHEVGWYQRDVTMPNGAPWRRKRVILTIGASDFFTDLWCNGVHLGQHEGGYTPFEFDLTDALTAAPDGSLTGRVVIRVEDPMNNAEQPVGKQWAWYTTTSGIWQTVYLEPRDPAHLCCFRVVPRIRTSSASLEVDCAGCQDGDQLEIEVCPPDGQPIRQQAPVEANAVRTEVQIAPLCLWEPRNPHLYGLTLRLRRGEAELDRVISYIGMREVRAVPMESDAGPGALFLNGEPIYLRGALYQSYHPDGVYTAGEADTIRSDLLFAKQSGFDFVRVHIKIDDPLVLYYADTLGVMLMADFPNFGEGGDTQLGRQRFETMMRAAIQRDFNHPSLIAWCMFNETWGFGGQVELIKHFPTAPIEPLHRKPRRSAAKARRERVRLANLSSQNWVQAMWELAKNLDSTRLIEDMSVVSWEHLEYYGHGDTDINSWHFYLDDYEKAKKHIAEVVGSTYEGSTLHYASGFAQKSQPLINSEYGGVGALDGDRDVSWTFKFLTNELRLHRQISAYVYTQLHDVEWEYNGLLNYDRTRKRFGYDPAIINQGNVLPIDAPPISRRRPGETVSVPVHSSHFSRRKHKDVTLHWRLSGVDSLGTLHQDLASGRMPIAFPQFRVELAAALQFELPRQAMLCTLSVAAITPEGVPVAQNFVHLFVQGERPRRRETGPRSVILRGSPAEWTAAEWSGGHGSAAEARRDGYCFGFGHGFFEWHFPVEPSDLNRARRLRVLCEASSHRFDHPQTDELTYPTELAVSLNELPVFNSILPDHPHDSRGALSYLKGVLGAYGYLVRTAVEGPALDYLRETVGDGGLRLRCAVPAGTTTPGGLTLYGPECGRFPVPPTLALEW